MTMVCGLDLHRRQITFDALEVESGQVWTGRVWQPDRERYNPRGGAIAIGHPLGASGARLITMLAHELNRQKGHYGLATMCIGVGQGIATIIERLDT